MGYFNRFHGQGPGRAEISTEELREWLVEDVPLTPHERALLDVQSQNGENLLVVFDGAGVVATVVESSHGAVWTSLVGGADGTVDGKASAAYQLLEWEGERPMPLRLLASRYGEAPVLLDPEQILVEVRTARSTGKVRRIHF